MRILIVTASMGAGHTAVAQELARRLAKHRVQAEVVDLLRLTPSGERLRQTYRLLLADAPWLYDAAMRFWTHHPEPMQWLTARGAGPTERALLHHIRATTPDAIVSTYNLASQALGRLRMHGSITAPVITLVTDPGAHPYWISRGVAAHIVPLPQTATALTARGAHQVLVAPPLVRPEVRAAPARSDARRQLHLLDRRIVLVSAGSWTAGHIEKTVAALQSLPGTTTVVLCGHDARLQDQLAQYPGVRAVGWTRDMPAYLAAADVVVDNAGGLTCWEALSIATPVIICDPLPGHGRLNAATLAAAGLVQLARDRHELGQLVLRSDHAVRTFAPAGVGAEQHVLRLAARPRQVSDAGALV